MNAFSSKNTRYWHVDVLVGAMNATLRYRNEIKSRRKKPTKIKPLRHLVNHSSIVIKQCREVKEGILTWMYVETGITTFVFLRMASTIWAVHIPRHQELGPFSPFSPFNLLSVSFIAFVTSYQRSGSLVSPIRGFISRSLMPATWTLDHTGTKLRQFGECRWILKCWLIDFEFLI